MRHRKLSTKLSRPTAHRQAMLSNMVKSLFQYSRIQTTLPKARVASSLADKMITLAKKKDLSAERRAAQFLVDRSVIKRLFREIGPRFEGRNGGYTRVIRLGRRPGDRASMAILELTDYVPPVSSSMTGEEAKGKNKLEEAKA
ncbi:MAG: 50S ribosomal protein L17 [Chlamydiae bacterium]|nr:50S ribosomal protein L17 [Chlamydiota bacterium]MBI3277001.1 50S ribosomal protein L17 [Chlamydiota bacterium]